MTTTDLRIIRTEQELRQSLEKLMATIRFSKISVNQVCESAAVHRTTFYKHFHDKQELLHHYLEHALPSVDSVDFNRMIITPYELFHEIFTQQFNDLIKFQYTDQHFYDVFTPYVLDYFTDIFDRADVRAKVPNDLLANMFGGELFSQLYWRLIHHKHLTLQEMDRNFLKISKIPEICGLA